MAFNGSGTFNRVYDWTDDADNSINIDATRMDEETDGIALGLSTCITKDGQTTITADIPMSGFSFTGLADGAAAAESATYGQTITASAINSSTSQVTLTRSAGNLTFSVFPLDHLDIASDGISVIGSVSPGVGGTQDSLVRLYQADGTTNVGVLGFGSNANLLLRSLNDGGNVLVQANDAGSVLRTLMTADPDAQSVNVPALTIASNPVTAITESSFSPTWIGFSSAPSGTAYYKIVGNTVHLTLPAQSGTSNSTSFSIQSIPAAIQPATLQFLDVMALEDSGSGVIGRALANLAGDIVFYKDATSLSSTTWTASGSKGIFGTGTSYINVSYKLD